MNIVGIANPVIIPSEYSTVAAAVSTCLLSPLVAYSCLYSKVEIISERQIIDRIVSHLILKRETYFINEYVTWYCKDQC